VVAVVGGRRRPVVGAVLPINGEADVRERGLDDRSPRVDRARVPEPGRAGVQQQALALALRKRSARQRTEHHECQRRPEQQGAPSRHAESGPVDHPFDSSPRAPSCPRNTCGYRTFRQPNTKRSGSSA
jgi:hypothetical protein